MLTQADMQELFEAGHVYRHSIGRWNTLKDQAATLFPSPQREVRVGEAAFIEELIQPTLEPFVLAAQEVAQLRNLALAWDQFTRAQLALVHEGLSGSDSRFTALAETVVPARERAVALNDPGYTALVSPFIRLDMIRTQDGFRVIDINTTCPLGLGDYLLLDKQYQLRNPRLRGFDAGGVFRETVLKCFRGWQARYGSPETEPNLGILISADAGEWHNFQVLGEDLARRGISVRFITDVPEASSDINCVLRGQVKFGHPQFERLVTGAPSRYAVMSPPGRRFLGSKFWFVALRMPGFREIFEDRLGQAAYCMLNEVIPKTGILTGDGTIAFPEATVAIQDLNRKGWLLKPSSGACARGVMIGRSSSKKKWDEFCSSSESAGTVVQEYFNIKETALVLGPDGSPQNLEGHTKYGAFLYGGEVAGCEVMLRPHSSLVHGARDTYLSVCVWREET
ncbi:MAG: hypothetical protein HYS45_00760 [Parcubacteria group bacterium]|nr:hypothetical protein [Parcubacteria group bacterium]